MARDFERFKEVTELGAGAFGKTLLVEDRAEGGRRIVIKVPHDEENENTLIDELINNAWLKERLKELKEMEHRNIVKYMGHAKHAGRRVMMLEYVKGKNLRKIVGPIFQTRPPLELYHALRFTMYNC